jgi:hypothetical protein
MFIVLGIGLKVRGFNPSRSDGFLRAIKIHGTRFFGGEIKQLATCCKILPHVKNHLEV